MKLRFVTALLVFLAASAIAGAQQRPVFRAEANYVEVDAVVTDQQGHFVTGLTAADFELREAYKPQRIDLVDYVNLAPGRAGAPGPASAARVRPTLGLQPGDLNGRIYLLYLNLADPQSLVEIGAKARLFIEDFVEPGDLVGLWNSDSMSQTLTFTTDKTELLKALPPLGHVAAGSTQSGNQISKLDDAVEFLSGIQGRRKALILLSPGWPATAFGPWGTNAAASVPWVGQPGGPVVTPGRPLMSPFWDTPSDITGLADVQIYTVDSRGLAAPPMGPRNAHQLSAALDNMTWSNDMLRSIADETGGLAIFNTNDYRAGFARIVEDNSRYYVLGYSSAITARNHRFVHLDLRTVRPGLTVRARKGYFTR